MNPNIPHIIILFTICILFYLILPLCFLDNEIEILLEDDHITITRKAACCRKKITVYSKNQLIKLDLEEKEVEDKINFKVYYVYLILNDSSKELLFMGNSERYTIEEIRYLLFCVNNHISTKMH